MPARPIHTGRVLRRELTARGLSANRLALAMRVPSGRITSLLNGKRAVTAGTALRLSVYFSNDAAFRMNLQTHYDLALAEAEQGKKIRAEVAAATS